MTSHYNAPGRAAASKHVGPIRRPSRFLNRRLSELISTLAVNMRTVIVARPECRVGADVAREISPNDHQQPLAFYLPITTTTLYYALPSLLAE